MTPIDDAPLAPEIASSRWFNTDHTLTLAGLRGNVVMLHAFQMLCAGCTLQATPQAARMWLKYREAGLKVIGLHTVFEHHAVMTPAALAVYLYEFRIPFPVGVDLAQEGEAIPRSMQTYRLQGTPSTLLIDCAGRLRHQRFGMETDEALARNIATLLAKNSA